MHLHLNYTKIAGTWAPRLTTVEAIYSTSNSERMVQVSHSLVSAYCSKSGKTILLKLLRKYTSKVDHGAEVRVISSWLYEAPLTTLVTRLSAQLPGVDVDVGEVDPK